MRVVFLGSPPFATPILRRLLQSHHEVLGLVTPPDRPRGRGRAVVRGELAALADHARAAGAPEADELMPWDRSFWSERLRESRYDFSDEELEQHEDYKAEREAKHHYRRHKKAGRHEEAEDF